MRCCLRMARRIGNTGETMQVITTDGKSHHATLSERHVKASRRKMMVVLTETQHEIDEFGWKFCFLASASEQERQALRDAGYRC